MKLLNKLKEDGPLPEKIITVENCGCRSFSTIPGTEY
jgi:hypothetical protein